MEGWGTKRLDGSMVGRLDYLEIYPTQPTTKAGVNFDAQKGFFVCRFLFTAQSKLLSLLDMKIYTVNPHNPFSFLSHLDELKSILT